jgi:hypothetical protein
MIRHANRLGMTMVLSKSRVAVCGDRGQSRRMKKPHAQNPEDGEELSVEKTLNLIGRLIEKIEQQLGTAEAKGSIADYIKLLQLQKELEEKRYRRIEVKWVDAD